MDITWQHCWGLHTISSDWHKKCANKEQEGQLSAMRSNECRYQNVQKSSPRAHKFNCPAPTLKQSAPQRVKCVPHCCLLVARHCFGDPLHQIPVCKNPTHRLEAQNSQHGDEFYDVNFKSQFNLVLTLVRHPHCHKKTLTFYLAHVFRKTYRHKLLTQQHDVFSSLWNYTFKNSKRDAKAQTPESPWRAAHSHINK